MAQNSSNASKERSFYKDWHYYAVSCISNIVVPNETRVIAEEDVVIIVTSYVTMAAGKPCKSTLYFVFSCLCLKNELGDPHFLFLESYQTFGKV